MTSRYRYMKIIVASRHPVTVNTKYIINVLTI